MKLRIAQSNVYLIPSIHLTYEPFEFSHDERRAIEEADVLMLEAKAEMPPEHWYRHTAPHTIADELPAEYLERFEAAWRSCELPQEDFLSTRLWWASMLIGVRSHMRRGARFDWGTEAMARQVRCDRSIDYLESADEAFSAFANAPNEELVSNASDILFRLDERMQQMDDTLALVKQGDLSGCASLYEQYIEAFPVMWGAALGQRNRRWMPKILEHVKSDRHAVCIVGAMHLVGDRGLPEMLRAEGFPVVPE